MNNSLAKEKNAGWQKTDEAVLASLYELMGETHLVPSYQAIANKAGVTMDTVRRHLKDKSVTEFSGDFKQHVPFIIEAMAKKAIEGDVSAAKLYLQVSGFSEKTSLDATVKADTTIAVRFVSPTDDLSEVAEFDIMSDEDEDGLPDTVQQIESAVEIVEGQ